MPPPLRRPRARPLADLLEPVLGPALASQGFGSAAVVLHWADVVGERLAARSEPVGLRWPPRPGGGGEEPGPRRGGTLTVRVEGAFAPELQHLAPVIAERVNALAGWRLVERVSLRQGPSGAGRGGRRAPPPPPSPAARSRATTLAAGVEEGPVRAALERLGAGVIARGGR